MIGKDIIMSHKEHFSLVNLATFNKNTSKHSLDTQIDKFLTEVSGEKVEINKTVLRNYYNRFKRVYDELIDKYIQNNLKDMEEILREIRNCIRYT